MGLVFDAARRVAAIVLGRAGMDLYPVPDGADTESAEYFAAEIGGSAANIAVAIARHNHKAALLAVFSDDAVGRWSVAGAEQWSAALSSYPLSGPVDMFRT